MAASTRTARLNEWILTPNTFILTSEEIINREIILLFAHCPTGKVYRYDPLIYEQVLKISRLDHNPQDQGTPAAGVTASQILHHFPERCGSRLVLLSVPSSAVVFG